MHDCNPGMYTLVRPPTAEARERIAWEEEAGLELDADEPERVAIAVGAHGGEQPGARGKRERAAWLAGLGDADSRAFDAAAAP